MHLDEKALEKFQNEEMNARKMTAFLEHIDNCDFCLEKMLEKEDAAPTISAPLYLKGEILSRRRLRKYRPKRHFELPPIKCSFFIWESGLP